MDGWTLGFEREGGVLFAVDTSLSERVAGKARIKAILSLSLLICRWCCVTMVARDELRQLMTVSRDLPTNIDAPSWSLEILISGHGILLAFGESVSFCHKIRKVVGLSGCLLQQTAFLPKAGLQ